MSSVVRWGSSHDEESYACVCSGDCDFAIYQLVPGSPSSPGCCCVSLCSRGSTMRVGTEGPALDAIRSLLVSSQVQYAFFRIGVHVVAEADSTAVEKLILIRFVGDDVSPVFRGRAVSLDPQVQALFHGTHVHLSCNGFEEFDPLSILQRVSAALGLDEFKQSSFTNLSSSTEPGTSNCGIDSSTDEASSMPIDDLSSSHPISLDCDSQCPTTHLSTPIAIAASSTGFENEESIDDISHLPLPNRVDFSLIDSFFEKNASRDAKISMSLPSFLSNYYALHSEVPDPATAEATKKDKSPREIYSTHKEDDVMDEGLNDRQSLRLFVKRLNVQSLFGSEIPLRIWNEIISSGSDHVKLDHLFNIFEEMNSNRLADSPVSPLSTALIFLCATLLHCGDQEQLNKETWMEKMPQFFQSSVRERISMIWKSVMNRTHKVTPAAVLRLAESVQSTMNACLGHKFAVDPLYPPSLEVDFLEALKNLSKKHASRYSSKGLSLRVCSEITHKIIVSVESPCLVFDFFRKACTLLPKFHCCHEIDIDPRQREDGDDASSMDSDD